MTTTIQSPLATAQRAWLEAEYVARAAFALVRLDTLDKLHADLTEADGFDAAYAIWDDYIDGRRADERMSRMRTAELREAATIFARVVSYLGAADVLALARAAFGTATFEVFTRNEHGVVTGKLAWYRGGTLHVRQIGRVPGAPGFDLIVSDVNGEPSVDLRPLEPYTAIVLHPAFARAE